MSALVVREAEPADFASVDALLGAAFPTREEADLVAALRGAGDFALELVAEAFGDVVGYAGFPRLDASDGVRAAALAPLAVVEAARRRGVGGMLVNHGLPALAEAGFGWCVVLGDPGYYGRFGFSAEAAEGFETPYDGPHQMAVALVLGGPPARGRLSYPPAFAALG